MSLDLERLYDDNAVGLMRYLVRLSGDAELAADIVQETFLRCAQHQPDEAHAREWLFRVANNLVKETGRTSRRRLRILAASTHRVPSPEPAETPDIEYRRERARERVRAALMQLAPRDRMALLMREEGFSQREIASALGIGNNSVGKTIMRALERFARHAPREYAEGGS